MIADARVPATVVLVPAAGRPPPAAHTNHEPSIQEGVSRTDSALSCVCCSQKKTFAPPQRCWAELSQPRL